MKETVSIIVPVYNAEKYLEHCVRSICAQTYTQLDIILVDDGSADDSLALAKKYAAQDKRIRVLHQKNKGPSAARNAGLQAAKGKYVFFCDADDVMHQEQIGYLAQEMPESGMSVCGYTERTDKVPCRDASDGIYGSGSIRLNSAQMQWRLFSLSQEMYQGYLWNKLFCRSVIEKNGLRFEEEIFCNEDRLFILQYLRCIAEVSYSREPLYEYEVHPDGIMEKSRAAHFHERMWSEITAYEKMRVLVGQEDRCSGGILYDEYFSLYHLLDKEMPPERKRMIRKMMRELLKGIMKNRWIVPKKKLTAVIRYGIRG